MRINRMFGDTLSVANIEVTVEFGGEVGSGLRQTLQEHT